MGDVDAQPLPVELLRRRYRRPAAAEGVEDDVALVGGCADDAFEEGLGLLRRVAEGRSGARSNCVCQSNRFAGERTGISSK